MGNGTSRLYSALSKTLSSSAAAQHPEYLVSADPEHLEPIDPKELLEECRAVLHTRPPRYQRCFVGIRTDCLSSYPPIRVMQWNILAQGMPGLLCLTAEAFLLLCIPRVLYEGTKWGRYIFNTSDLLLLKLGSIAPWQHLQGTNWMGSMGCVKQEWDQPWQSMRVCDPGSQKAEPWWWLPPRLWSDALSQNSKTSDTI